MWPSPLISNCVNWKVCGQHSLTWCIPLMPVLGTTKHVAIAVKVMWNWMLVVRRSQPSLGAWTLHSASNLRTLYYGFCFYDNHYITPAYPVDFWACSGYSINACLTNNRKQHFIHIFCEALFQGLSKYLFNLPNNRSSCCYCFSLQRRKLGQRKAKQLALKWLSWNLNPRIWILEGYVLDHHIIFTLSAHIPAPRPMCSPNQGVRDFPSELSSAILAHDSWVTDETQRILHFLPIPRQTFLGLKNPDKITYGRMNHPLPFFQK